MGKRFITKGSVLVVGLFAVTGFVAGVLWSVSKIAEAVVVLALACMMLVWLVKKGSKSMAQQQQREVERLEGELKWTVEQFQYALDMVEHTSKAKSEFLNRMSHDLRTPMNAIMGYSLLLNQIADSPEKVRDYADKITVSSQVLLGLINDVLDMSSIESGNIKLIKSKFSLSDALEEVMVSVKPQIEEKSQKFNFYITNTAEKDIFIGDKQRLCQILQNLLSNAVKYSAEEGQIDFIVNAVEVDKGVKMLFQIKDNGYGMSAEFLERMFEPFERDINPEISSVQGTGLGLCIAKHLIELMGGSIKVDSRKNAGTLVTVSLILKPANSGGEEESLEDIDEMILRGMHFLAAEDNASNAEILKEVLASKGATCLIVENGQEAIKAFRESQKDEYDMILMDVQMPVMNGYEAAAGIRACDHPRAEEIDIIAMTADAFDDDVQRALLSGMNAHVAKPLNLQTFVNTVKSLKK